MVAAMRRHLGRCGNRASYLFRNMSHTFHRYRVGDEPVAGYRLTDHLGAGGFGEVWKATAPGGTEVALKIIDLTGQQGVQEFASLKVVKKVRHPNLISLQAFWMKDEEGQIVDEIGTAATAKPVDVTMTAPLPTSAHAQAATDIAMTTRFSRPVELIIAMQLGSMSLHKRLEECREQGLPGVPVAELLEYLEQAARGIDFLNKPIHDLGKGPMPIVHGDIKPHNILVIGDAAVVCDFGLARAVETLRKTSMAPVTVAYAAPESFKGKVTPTSDQYSLAITYAELRTGRLPFDETMTPYQVMEAHVTRNLDFTRLPDPEREVVLRATEADPEQRWQSSRDMVLALRQAVALTGELPLRPGEMAFTGGPTPSHSLTGRPMSRETGRPTMAPVDRHKETMHPGGRTPSHLLSRQTAEAPEDERSYAETSMLGIEGTVVSPPRKKSRGLLLGMGAVVVLGGAAAAVFLLPKLNEKPMVPPVVPSINKGGQPAIEQVTQTNDSNTQPGTTSQPGTEQGGKVETQPVDPNSQYIKAVQEKINAGEFEAAIKLLDKSPSSLPAFEKEALAKRLRSGFMSYIDTFVESGSFRRALENLDDAPKGIGLTNEDKTAQREKIRARWLAQAQEEMQNEEVDQAIETASSLLKRFEGDRDAQLIVARCNVRKSDYPAAAAMLDKLGKTADLPKDYQPLCGDLRLLVAGLQSTSNDPVKLVDGFLEQATIEQGAAPPANLAPSPWERAKLESLRTRAVDGAERILDSLPADKKKELLAKLERLGASVEVQMSKVKLQLDEKQFAEARKTLKELGAKAPADNADLKTEMMGTAWLIDLRDPATKPADFSKVAADAGESIGKVSPALRNAVCAEVESAALGSQPALLEMAIKLNGKAHDLDPGDAQLTKGLARLLAARITQRAEQPLEPSKDELKQLTEQIDRVEDAKQNTAVTDAFHAECLILQDSRDRQQMMALVERAKPVSPYTQYVQARVLRAAGQPDWANVTQLLKAAYGNGSKPATALAAPYRRSAAAGILIEAAAKKRSTAAIKPETVLASPMVDAAAAQEAYELLSLARALSEDLQGDLKLGDAQQRELQVNLMLAAAWKGKPDDALAHSLSGQLVKLRDADLGANALPVLVVAFRSHQSDQQTAIQAAQRITELFQKQFSVADQQAAGIYEEVTQPGLALAETLKVPPPDTDTFYAAAAEFINHYQRVPKWPFADKQVEQERLLTLAIKLNSKVAKYYTSRGVARVSQVPPNITGALADADEASKIDPNLPAAFALQGHALMYRSRQDPTRDSRMADLDQSLAKSQLAVEKSKPDDKERPTHLLYVSMAHLEKANFETDPQIRKDHLLKAVEAAEEAVKTEKVYTDYAQVALGNALEDLGWLVGEKPEENFAAAIRAFSEAINSNLASADPWVSRARCYYRAMVDAKIDPKVLDRNSTEEVLQAAIADLQQARQLNENLIEPNLWLGKAYQQIGKFKEADEALTETARLAEEQKLPERALYLAEWARSALANQSLSDAERSKVVRDRAEKLKAAPDVGGMSSAKQAALLIGNTLVAEKNWTEALKEYDSALADLDKLPIDKLDSSKGDGADVSLLLARAFCRLNLPETQWNLAAFDGVQKDATRIGQLKPGPHFEALANWYAANAYSRNVRSASGSFPPDQKPKYFDGALSEVRKAISTAPNDPGSWEWRLSGVKLLNAKIQVAPANTPPDTLKALGTEARQWMDDAIAMVGKRSDLASQMDALQRAQQDLERLLTAKKVPR
jgi:serine/threonine protein kinase/tetratricopeptide (TPR) repeat protein